MIKSLIGHEKPALTRRVFLCPEYAAGCT